MHKGLLVWNITLSIVLVGGLLAGFFYIRNYNSCTEEELATLRQHIDELTVVMAQQSATINEHAYIINGRMENMNYEVTTAIENNDALIVEMNGLIKEYQQVINTSAAYFDVILDNLKELSRATSAEPVS
jgi:uncharacterized coiled-coil protein SlyX